MSVRYTRGVGVVVLQDASLTHLLTASLATHDTTFRHTVHEGGVTLDIACMGPTHHKTYISYVNKMLLGLDFLNFCFSQKFTEVSGK